MPILLGDEASIGWLGGPRLTLDVGLVSLVTWLSGTSIFPDIYDGPSVGASTPAVPGGRCIESGAGAETPLDGGTALGGDAAMAATCFSNAVKRL